MEMAFNIVQNDIRNSFEIESIPLKLLVYVLAIIQRQYWILYIVINNEHTSDKEEL